MLIGIILSLLANTTYANSDNTYPKRALYGGSNHAPNEVIHSSERTDTLHIEQAEALIHTLELLHKTAVHEGNAQLIAKIDKGLQQLQNSRRDENGFNHWLGKSPKRDYYQLLISILLIIVGVVLLWGCFMATMKRKIKREIKKGNLSDKQFVEIIRILFKDKNIEIFIGNYLTGEIYKYQEKESIIHSLKEDIYITKIHPEDLKRYHAIKEKIEQREEDYVITEIRLFNTSKGKYCHYEFIIAILERDKGGKVIRYVFSQRDCSKDKEVILQQKKLINHLNLSLKVGKLYRWDYDLKSHHSKVTTYCGQVHEINNNSITLVQQGSKMKLLRYIHAILSDKAHLPDMEIWVHSTYHQENRLYRLTAVLERDKSGIATNIHGIWKDITEENKLTSNLANLQKKIIMALEVGEMSTWEYNCLQEEFTVIHGDSINEDQRVGITRANFLENTHPEDRVEILNTFERIKNRELTKSTHHFRFKSSKGSRDYLTSFIPIFENEQLKSIMGVRRNITREVSYQKSLKEKIKKIKMQSDTLKMILESLPIPILIRSLQTKTYTYANKAAIEQYGAETGVNSIYTILSSKQEKESEFMQENESYETLEIIQTKDGRVLETVVSKGVINYNDEKQHLISRIDLTESLKTKRFLATFMPALKAYSWYYDSRFKSINIQHNMLLEREINGTITEAAFLEAVHPEDRELFHNQLASLLNEHTTGVKSFQFRMDLEKQGAYEWWESNVAIENLSENNKPYKLVSGITVNINERKSAELELTRLNKYNELILNHSNSLLAYVTTDYRTIWSNAESALAGQYKQMYGTPNTICYETKGESKPCQLCPIAKALTTQSVSEHEFLTKEGVWFKSTTIPVPHTEGVPKGVILKIDDVTEYKRLIADLETSRSKAEESDRLKSAFLANMSHEIRTPLNAIVGYSELLQESDSINEKEEYIKIINSNNKLLLHLIGDILDYSKIEAGTIELHLTTFDYSAYMEEQFMTHHALYAKPGVEIVAHNPFSKCIITIDKAKCSQIEMNFLSNAVKYTAQGHIRFGYDYIENGLLLFVEDTGIGIAKEKQQLLFERFEKAGSFVQGAGLGLSIAKAITERMGGKIGVESEEGKGSLFWAWIPCEAEIETSSKSQLAGANKFLTYSPL